MQCPGCTQADLSDDGLCHACGGIWLAEDKVREAVRDHAAAELEFTGGTFSQRRCPVCSTKMQLPFIFDVAVDRCMEHGMWFDRTELAEVLKRSHNDEWRLYGTGYAIGGPPWSPATHGSRTWWNPIGALVEVVRAWRRGKEEK